MSKIKLNKQTITKYHKKLNIGFIFNHSYFLGGGEISFFELIRKLDKEHFKPIAIVPALGEIERKLKCNNVEVHALSLPSAKKIGALSPLRGLFSLVKLVKKSKIDLIHNNGPRACFYGAIAGRVLKIPVIWHVRESLKDLLFYDYLLAKMSNVIICVSNSVKSKRFGRFGQQINKKIRIVYNGIDTNKFQVSNGSRYKVRTQLFVKSNDILVGLVGNIIPRKAQDFFLKGLAKAKHIRPDLGIKALLIGRPLDEEFGDYIRKLVIDLNLSSNVIFREFSDKIPNIFSALDIFALTSKSEGFCRSLLEAMMCGLPVIASKIDEIEEAVVDQKNAILVNINDIEKMASAIIRLCEDSFLRKKMGILNRNIAVKQFSLSTHVASIESIYNCLLDKKEKVLN